MNKFFLSSAVIGASAIYMFSYYAGQHADAAALTMTATTSAPPLDGSPITVPTFAPTTTPAPAPAPARKPTGQYVDGSYTGSAGDAYYGYVQVKAIISGGKLTDIQFLQYPNDRNTSVYINSQALPILKSEAIQAQSARVNSVSGASDSSAAFKSSLSSALAQAKA